MLGIHQYLWRLVPANPILLRVVETGGRRRRDLYIRCAYLGLLVALVVFSLVTGNMGSGSLSSLAKISADIFQKMSYLQLGLVALLAPVFTAGAITQEKDSQTYDILLATPLNNGQIVLGSLLSRLFFVIALLVSGIPIFSITQIFGGVAIKSIVASFGIAAATAFATGALAMAIATFKVGTRRTIFSFYLFIVVYMAGGIVLDQFARFQVAGPMQTTTGSVETGVTSDDGSTNYATQPPIPAVRPSSVSTGQAHISWFTGINPFLALRVLFRSPDYAPPHFEDLPPALQRWPTGWYLSDPAGFYISVMFAFSLILVLPSIVLLRRMAQSSTSIKTLVLQRLNIVKADRTRKPRIVWSNPIAWREAKTKASAARASFLRYGFILAGLIVAGYLVVQYASTSTVANAITGANYEAKSHTLTVPSSEAGQPAKPYRILPFRTEVAMQVGSDQEEHQEKFVLENDLRGAMEIVRLVTFADEPAGADDYGAAREIGTHDPATVIKTLLLRPASHGVSPWLLRKYLLGACAIEFAVILLIVTNAAASTVTREKEDGTLDLLLSSPITSRYYIWGKLRGLVSFVLPLVAVPIASIAMFVIYDLTQSISGDPQFQWTVFPEAIVLLPGMLVIVCAFAAILGMQMSLRCRTTVTAVMSSVGIVVGICGAMGFCGAGFLSSSQDFIARSIGSFSPFTLMQLLIDPYGSSRSYREASPDDITNNRIQVGLFAVIAVVAYVALVWQMYTGMVKNFDMTIRKQSR